MNQTPAAILCLAASMLAVAAVTGFSTDNQMAGALLTWITVGAALIGVLSLVRACLRDHDMAIDVRGRLDFLEELVRLERLSLDRKEQLRRGISPSTSAQETPVRPNPDRATRRPAA
jgi:hypothetical protein